MTLTVGNRTGQEIAALLGVQYNGIQNGPDEKFAGYVFTDYVTQSTFIAKDLGSARRSLKATRRRFGRA